MENDIEMEIWNIVYSFFDYRFNKTVNWMRTRNPMLGNVSPNEMIHMGREEKLHEFVMEARTLNEQPKDKT